jgi:hypothetical protein
MITADGLHKIHHLTMFFLFPFANEQQTSKGGIFYKVRYKFWVRFIS